MLFISDPCLLSGISVTWMHFLQVQLFPLCCPFLAGVYLFVCVCVCSPGAVLSTVCFNTTFLLINTFTAIMTSELKEVLNINYTDTDSGII